MALFSTPRPGIGGMGPAFDPTTFGVAGAQAQAFATPQYEPPPEPAPPPDYSADLAAQAQAFATPDYTEPPPYTPPPYDPYSAFGGAGPAAAEFGPPRDPSGQLIFDAPPTGTDIPWWSDFSRNEIRPRLADVLGSPAILSRGFADVADVLGAEGVAERYRRGAESQERGGEFLANFFPASGAETIPELIPGLGFVPDLARGGRSAVRAGFREAVTPEPTVLRVAARPEALADLPPDSLAAALGSKTIADPAGVRILGPGEAPAPGEVEMFHGTASTGIDNLRPGTFVTPDVRQAQSYARSAVALETRPAGLGRRLLLEGERGSVNLPGGTPEPTPATAGMRESIEALHAEQAGRAAAKGAGDLQPGDVEAPDLVKELQRRIGETPAPEPRPPTQLEEDLQKVIRGTDTDLSGAPRNYDVSDEALIQNLQEGIAVQDAMGVRELPWSVLHRYERDPITVQKGGLESAIRNLGGTPILGRKPELAAQLRALWEDSLRGAADRIRVAREALAESAPDMVPSSALQRMEEASEARRAEWLASGGGTPEIWDDLLGVRRVAAAPPSPPAGTVPPRLGGTPGGGAGSTPPPGGAGAAGTPPYQPPPGAMHGPNPYSDDLHRWWQQAVDATRPKDQNILQEGLQFLKAPIAGEFRDPYIQFLWEKLRIADDMLAKAGYDEKARAKLVNEWGLAEARTKRGNYAQADADMKALADNKKQAQVTAKEWRQFLLASQRTKNTTFGLADMGVFGVNLLNTARTGNLPVIMGTVHKILETVHTPGFRSLYAMMDAPKEQQRILDGFRPNKTWMESGVDPQAGTLISYAPVVGKPLDAIPTAVSDAATRLQFNGIMGALRSLAYEGNLWTAQLRGADISKQAVRKTAYDNAEAVTSGAKTAATAKRSVAEGAALTSSQYSRAMMNRIVQMMKAIRPDASLMERQVAATTILSNVAFVATVGTVLNDQIGVGDFEMNPTAPDFGWITTKWKDSDGRNIRINMMSQASGEKALANTIGWAMSQVGLDPNGAKHDDPTLRQAGENWLKFGVTRPSPLLSSGLRMATGFGYGPGGRFYNNPTPPWDTGYGMSMADRIQASLPLPLATQLLAPKAGQSIVNLAKGEPAGDPTAGGSPVLSPEVALTSTGFSSYGESAFSELDRRFPEAMRILGNREVHPPILKQAWANVTDYDQLGNREKRDVQAALGPDFAKRFDEDVAGMRRSEERDATDYYYKILGSESLTYKEKQARAAKYLDEVDKDNPKLGAAVRENIAPKTDIQAAINRYYEVPFNKRTAYMNELFEYDPGFAHRVWYNVKEEKK